MRIVKHYFVFEDFSSEDARKAAAMSAADDLKEYAHLAEAAHRHPPPGQHPLPPSLLTHKLHVLVCHLPTQELARGHRSGDHENWVERSIGDLKRSTRYHCSSKPEAVGLNSMLLSTSLQEQRAAHPLLKTIPEMKDDGYTGHQSWDPNLDSDECFMLGCTVKRKGPPRGFPGQFECQQTDDKVLIDSFLRTQDSKFSGYEPADLVLSSISVYSRARLRDSTVSSILYSRSKSRVNHFIKLRFANQVYIGENARFIMFSLRIPFDKYDTRKQAYERMWRGKTQDPLYMPFEERWPEPGAERVIRIACLRLWAAAGCKYGSTASDPDLVIVPSSTDAWQCAPQEKTSRALAGASHEHDLYPVELRKLDHKVSRSQVTNTRGEEVFHYLKPYVTSRHG